MRNIRKKKQLPDYNVGGWLKDNWVDVAKTAGGIGAMFVPGMQTMGAGLISSGAQGMMQNAQQGQAQQQQELLARQQAAAQQTQAMQQNMQNYTPTFQTGGNLPRNPNTYRNQVNSLKRIMDNYGDINVAGQEMERIIRGIPFENKKDFYSDFITAYPKGGKYYGLSYEDLLEGDNPGLRLSLTPKPVPPREGIPPLPVEPMGNPINLNSPLNRMKTRLGVKGKYFAQGGVINGNDMNGQYIDYNIGQDHFGPDEGIPVDAKGQPVAMSGGQAVGLTEKGEVTYNGQVFSDSNKLPGNKKRTFADEAKRIAKKYKFYLGDKLDKKEDVSRRALERELQQLFDIQEARKGNMMHQDDVEQLLQQQQEAQAQAIEQGMMQEQQMQQDPAMQQQMMEQQGGVPMEQPMMRQGGKLPKYENGSKLIPLYNHNLNMGPTSMGYYNDYKLVGGPTSMGNTHDISINAGPTSTDLGIVSSPNLQPMQPSPLPAMVGAGMGILNSAVGLVRNRKSKQPTLKLDRTLPEQINLEGQRADIRNRGTVTSSAVRRDLARRGTGQGAYMAGTAGAMADINRGVGEQVGQSYLAEQTANMQARQQANAINMQQANQEKFFNTQAGMQNRATQDQLIASGMNAIPAAFMDYQTQVGRQNMLNAAMAQGDMSIQQRIDPNANWVKRRLGLDRGKGEFYSNEYLRSLRT